MKAKVHGSGWHKESLRHKNAALKGKAGGSYHSKFPVVLKEFKAGKLKSHGRTITSKKQALAIAYYENDKKALQYSKTHPMVKDMTYKALSKKGIRLSKDGDADKDGVKNSKDCRPLDKKKQDDGMPAITIQTTEPELKTRDKITNWLKKENEKLKEYNKKQKEAKISKIERELETEEYVDENDRTRIESLDAKELNDKELKILAIREGTPFWGKNKYEEEIERRLREEAKIETDKRIVIDEEKKKSAERIREANNKKVEKGLFEGLFK